MNGWYSGAVRRKWPDALYSEVAHACAGQNAERQTVAAHRRHYQHVHQSANWALFTSSPSPPSHASAALAPRSAKEHVPGNFRWPADVRCNTHARCGWALPHLLRSPLPPRAGTRRAWWRPHGSQRKLCCSPGTTLWAVSAHPSRLLHGRDTSWFEAARAQDGRHVRARRLEQASRIRAAQFALLFQALRRIRSTPSSGLWPRGTTVSLREA